MCPTCGANLPVPPNASQVTCRYCQHVITIEHKKPPFEVKPFGTPGVAPSTTLYVDPKAVKNAGRNVGCFVLVMILVPILIPLGIGVGPWAYNGIKGIVKPYPVACDANEEITVSGNFEGAGPIVTTAGHNCKLHIKNSKLKGSMLVKTDSSNLELTIENSTIETTDTMIRTGSGLKLKVHGSTLTSVNGMVIDNASSVDFQELETSTLESKNASAVRSKYGLKIRAESSKLRGKKSAIDTESGGDIAIKKSCELTSTDGPAIKATSGFKLEAEGGKIESGGAAAILTESSLSIVATGLTINGKEDGIKTTSSLKLDLTDSTINSKSESAIDGDSSMNVTLANSKLNAVTGGITTTSSFRLKATKKTRIVAATGDGIVAASSSEMVINDSAVEAAGRGIKLTSSSCKVKMQQGARVAGKKGGLELDSSGELEGTGSTLEGGSGPGITGAYGTKVSFTSGTLKGTPALALTRPDNVDLSGTKVEGEQQVKTR